MFQRMANYVPITIDNVDMTIVSNIEVSFEQRSSGVELLYSGDNISVVDVHNIVVEMPKSDAMKLDDKPVRGQVMFTRDNGVPDATDIFQVPVKELLKDDGYGD